MSMDAVIDVHLIL